MTPVSEFGFILPNFERIEEDSICSKDHTVLPVVQGVPLSTKTSNIFKRAKAWLYDPRMWVTVKPHYYRFVRDIKIKKDVISAETILAIPAGFHTDFGSSPRFLWPLGMDPVGILQIPSLYHDFGYTHNFYLDQNGHKIFADKGKAFHDALFKAICEEVNNMKGPSYLSWAALDLFGVFAWNSSKKNHDGKLHLKG